MLEANIFVLSEKNEQDRDKNERLSKTHWQSDYAQDIFLSMKESELRRRPLLFLSKQLDERSKMLKLCQLATQHHRLTRCALHLCVYYFDRFIDRYTIRPDKMQLVALTCLHIAAQLENTDSFIPRYSELNRLVRHCYTPFEYKAVERKLLTFFQFELMRPTTATFVELFSCSFVTHEDYAAYSRMMAEGNELVAHYPHYESLEHMLAAMAQLLLRMADYTLNISRLGNERPSLLAASCIAAVRQVCGLPKRWTPYLTELTSYTEQMVAGHMDLIIIYHYYQSTLVKQVPPTTPMEAPSSAADETLNWSSPDSGFEEALSATPLQPVESIEQVSANKRKLQALVEGDDSDADASLAKRYKLEN